jgi:hypothetical protein
MLKERVDALGNKSTFTYDNQDIGLIYTKNSLNWETHYLYDYSIGKPYQITDHNSVISRFLFD